jgi:hypothetical protein
MVIKLPHRTCDARYYYQEVRDSMPHAKDSGRFEYDVVQDQLIRIVIHLPFGYRRGLNHDIKNVAPRLDSLVAFLLANDKDYQRMLRAGKKMRPTAGRRKKLVRLIVEDWHKAHLVFYLNDRWTLKVALTDESRKVGRHRRRNGVAHKDSSWHGRPKNQRRRLPQHVSS